MTNADWIRSMTDEELADWIRDYSMNECYLCCPTACENIANGICCRKGLANWLKHEHKEHGNDRE